MIDYGFPKVPILLNGLKRKEAGITQRELANKLGYQGSSLMESSITESLLRLRQHFASA